MSQSDVDLSGTDSDGESNNNHVIQKNPDTLRTLSDDEGVDHPAPNVHHSLSESSSSEDQDFRSNANNNRNDDDNDSPDDDDATKKASSDEEPEHKTKKKGRKKKGKKDAENENSDEGEKIDKEIEDMVKNAAKTKSIRYQEIDDPETHYEKQAKIILNKMGNALQTDYESYANRKFSFERIKYLRELESLLNNKKLAKALLRDNFLNYLAAWISPYEPREGDNNTDPEYPNLNFRIDVLKLLLKLKLKPEYFEESQDGKRPQIMKILQDMPVEEGSEISKLLSQVINKILRILTHADGIVPSSLIIDKEEAAEIKRNKDSEIAGYYSKSERRLEKAAQAIRKTNAVDRPRDYLPPPRIINANIKPPKRRTQNF